KKLEKDSKMLQDVIYHSSINFMREHLNKLLEEAGKMPRELIENHPDIPSGLKSVLLSDGLEMEKNG
ncbi:hypothetical protein AVEN_211404-1, partial [Araneus ventricosus]